MQELVIGVVSSLIAAFIVFVVKTMFDVSSAELYHQSTSIPVRDELRSAKWGYRSYIFVGLVTEVILTGLLALFGKFAVVRGMLAVVFGKDIDDFPLLVLPLLFAGATFLFILATDF